LRKKESEKSIGGEKMDIKKGKYKHFKGKYYEVIGIVYHSETEEKMVLYKSLYSSNKYGKNTLWVRPLRMFLENVEVDGTMVPRFKYEADIV